MKDKQLFSYVDNLNNKQEIQIEKNDFDFVQHLKGSLQPSLKMQCIDLLKINHQLQAE